MEFACVTGAETVTVVPCRAEQNRTSGGTALVRLCGQNETPRAVRLVYELLGMRGGSSGWCLLINRLRCSRLSRNSGVQLFFFFSQVSDNSNTPSADLRVVIPGGKRIKAVLTERKDD